MPKKKITTPHIGLIGVSDSPTSDGSIYSKDAIRGLAKKLETKGRKVELIERDGKLEAWLHVDIDFEFNAAPFSVGQKVGGKEMPEKEEVIVDDSGPAYPESFYYMVNSMASELDLKRMAQEFAKRVKRMPKGMSVRDWLVGSILGQCAAFVVRHDEPNKDGIGGWNRWWIDEKAVKANVDAAEALADEYLRRRRLLRSAAQEVEGDEGADPSV